MRFSALVVRRRSRRLPGPCAMLLFVGVLPLVPPSAIRDVIERRFLGCERDQRSARYATDLGVRHRNFPVVVGPPVGDIESERRPVDVDVEPLAMARCGGIDRLTRGPRIGQQERPVHGQPLGRCDGERITVVETDIAVPVADFVVMERYGPPVLGTCGYQDTRLLTGLSFFNLEVLHRDYGAVEQLLLPVCGANAELVAAYDLQRRGCPLVFLRGAPAYDHRHPTRIGPFSIRRDAANRRSRIR